MYTIGYHILDTTTQLSSGRYQSKVIPRIGEGVEIGFYDENDEIHIYTGDVIDVTHTSYEREVDVSIMLENKQTNH